MTIEEKQARKKEMQYHVQAWQKSHLSMKAYCTPKGLSFHALYYWVKKFRQSEPSDEDKFIPLLLNPRTEVTSMGIEILYPNGVRITLGKIVDMKVIGQLVKLV
jgi:hypothetical protein